MQAKPTCSIEDCGKPSRVRGWCSMHYRRWLVYGDVTQVRQPKFFGWFNHPVESTDRKENTIHDWMRKHHPKTGRCEWCASTKDPTHYASANGHRYTRNRADWLELCISCHLLFDGLNKQNRVGKRHSPEARAKISAAGRGRKYSAEARANMSAAKYRYWAEHGPMGPEQRANISLAKRAGQLKES